MGPLAGVRVVELGAVGPAPFGCMTLADLGADVIKIDRPDHAPLGIPAESDLANRGRPSVCVDLKRPAGVDLVRRLVDRADVFVEGYRPGVTERLGLGPDALLARSPSLVYARMTGWGQTGPLAPKAGHDVNFIAAAGALGAIGGPERPEVPLNLVGDLGGGALYLVVGVLAALLHARSTGEGQVVDVAIVDGVAHLTTPLHGLLATGLWTDARHSNLIDGGTPYYDVYAAGDGRCLAIGPLEEKFYAEFERLLGLDRPLPNRDDRRAWPELRARLAARIGELTSDEWMSVFASSDCCVTIVESLRSAADGAHLSARGTFVEVDGVVQPSPAPRFSATPCGRPAAPTRVGAGSATALAAWGIAEPPALVEQGVVLDESHPA